MFEDSAYLNETFKLARRGEGFTSPNPLVGAVIVKNFRVISRGYHRKAGSPHAEIEAIRKAKENLKGSTLYVNLEPCCYFGRTPPCVDEIIRNRIKRVVIASVDPNPRVRGRSIARLKKAGVKVSVGRLAEEARKLNAIFFKNMKESRPFVAVKTAQSLDGKIATRKGESKWITTPSSRQCVRTLRDRYDCVLIGANTLRQDNPRLDGSKKVPFKAVIARKLDFPGGLRLFRQNPDKLIIFASLANRKKGPKIPSGARIFFLKEKEGWISLKGILNILYSLGIMSVFVEGGSDTAGRFFLEKLADRAYFFIAPRIIGGNTATVSVGAEGFSSLKTCPHLEDLSVERIDKDILITGCPRY